MDKIFADEHKVVAAAELLLNDNRFDSGADAENYRLLCEEYKNLLRQTIKVVRLADRVQLELKTLSEKLEKASQVDVLTGLYNRMFFMKNCLTEWKSAVRAEKPLALVMFDIDYFKEYNDTYGHLNGDECLRTVSGQIACVLSRPRDVIGRFGGDEFVILLPETDIEGAKVVAGKVIGDINGLKLEHKGSRAYGILTLSIGITAMSPRKESVEVLFQQADKALYKAKSDGRNCYRVYFGGPYPQI